MLHALHLVATGLAQDHPRLLVVDDAHWGDASSLRALSYLAGRLAGTPLVLAISFRPAEPGAPEDLLDQLRAEPGVLSLTPTPLGPASVATLVRQRLPTADDDACRAAADVTAGNPLYVTELLRAVAQEGNGSAAAASIQRAALPSLGDRVSRRIARVADQAPALAAAMAVLGDGSSLAMAGRAGGRVAGGGGPDRPQPAPDRDPGLRGPGGVRPPAGPQLGLRLPDHRGARRPPRIGGATCWRPHTPRRRWWRPTGPRSGRPAAPEAAGAMARAAADAMARGAPDEAVRWYQRALEEEAPEPPRAELLAALGTSEVALLDPAALDHLGQALEDVDRPRAERARGRDAGPGAVRRRPVDRGRRRGRGRGRDAGRQRPRRLGGAGGDRPADHRLLAGPGGPRADHHPSGWRR